VLDIILRITYKECIERNKETMMLELLVMIVVIAVAVPLVGLGWMFWDMFFNA
jgi:hypothetical protein